jgi:hypothetical protein
LKTRREIQIDGRLITAAADHLVVCGVSLSGIAMTIDELLAIYPFRPQ